MKLPGAHTNITTTGHPQPSKPHAYGQRIVMGNNHVIPMPEKRFEPTQELLNHQHQLTQHRQHHASSLSNRHERVTHVVIENVLASAVSSNAMAEAALACVRQQSRGHTRSLGKTGHLPPDTNARGGTPIRT